MRSVSFAALAAFAFALSAALPGLPAALAAVDPALGSASHAIVRVAPGQAHAVAGFARSAGATDVQVLDSLDMLTAELDASSVDALSRNVAVRQVASDGPIAATGTNKDDDEETDRDDEHGSGPTRAQAAASRVFELSPSLTALDVTAAHRIATGRGVTVALMDSGIAKDSAFEGRVVKRLDFVKDGSRELDRAGHGTHLAGLIAGRSPAFTGVAPDAKLVSLRVLNEQGTGTVRMALAAVDWVLRNRAKYGIRVVNVSFGATQVRSYHDDPLAAAMESLWFAGVVVVAAAGNDGPSAQTITTPGADPFVVSVGAFNDMGTRTTADDQEAHFSSRGPTRDGFARPDLLAPGVKVESVELGWRSSSGPSRGNGRYPQRELTAMSGTSVSTALVSGIAALVLSANPGYTPTQVKGALLAGAGNVDGWSAPAANAARSLTAAPVVANAGLRPSQLLLDYTGATWAANVTWENITWENITWENISWESVTWEAVTWEAVTWEAITWEAVTWD